jgi:hypothetical protein
MLRLALAGFFLVFGVGQWAGAAPRFASEEPAQATAAEPAVQPAFNKTELTRFLEDFPKLLARVREAELQKDLSAAARDPEKGLASSKLVQAVTAVGWEPARFFYMLKHVTLAARAIETGGMGDQRLDLMRRKRAEVAASDLPEKRKQEILTELDESIRIHEQDVEDAHAIPKSELKLMWSRRSSIRYVLRNTFQLQSKRMANPSGR